MYKGVKRFKYDQNITFKTQSKVILEGLILLRAIIIYDSLSDIFLIYNFFLLHNFNMNLWCMQF